jgi:hypothetical protein
MIEHESIFRFSDAEWDAVRAAIPNYAAEVSAISYNDETDQEEAVSLRDLIEIHSNVYLQHEKFKEQYPQPSRAQERELSRDIGEAAQKLATAIETAERAGLISFFLADDRTARYSSGDGNEMMDALQRDHDRTAATVKRIASKFAAPGDGDLRCGNAYDFSSNHFLENLYKLWPLACSDSSATAADKIRFLMAAANPAFGLRKNPKSASAMKQWLARHG